MHNTAFVVYFGQTVCAVCHRKFANRLLIDEWNTSHRWNIRWHIKLTQVAYWLCACIVVHSLWQKHLGWPSFFLLYMSLCIIDPILFHLCHPCIRKLKISFPPLLPWRFYPPVKKRMSLHWTPGHTSVITDKTTRISRFLWYIFSLRSDLFCSLVLCSFSFNYFLSCRDSAQTAITAHSHKGQK